MDHLYRSDQHSIVRTVVRHPLDTYHKRYLEQEQFTAELRGWCAIETAFRIERIITHL